MKNLIISSFFKNTSFLSILLLYLVLSFILNFFFSIRFEENDDVAMLLISSGKYSSYTDNHLVFINFIYGSLLNLFYSLSTEIEWYTISLVLLNTLSVSIISAIITKSSYSYILKIVLLIFILSIFINQSIALQFTRTAAILSIAGISVIYNTKYKYMGIFLFVLGTLIRFEAGILVLIISLPLFLISKGRLREYFISKNFSIIVFTVLISVFCKMVDYLYYYADADWKSYMEYNNLRGKINDNPNTYNTINLPENILLEDYHLLKNSHINLSAITYLELKQILHAIDNITIFQKFNNIKRMVSKYRYHLLLVTLVTFLMFYQNKEQRFNILLIFFIFLGLLMYLSLNATVKARVFFPASFALMLFLFFLNKKRGKSFINLIISILITCFSAILLYNSYISERSNRLALNTFNKQSELVNKYLKNNNNKVLIPFGASYRIEHENPFCLSLTFPSQKILFAGWLINIPFNKGKFDSFKYYKNDYGLLVESNRTNVASTLILSSLLKHDSIKLFPKVVLNEYNLSIIEFRTDSTKNDKYNRH